jgi:DeoR family transcriptional regulator of aga operon
MASERRYLVPAQRRRHILELLRERGSVSIFTLAEEFGVSPMTARRDLDSLAKQGRARRTHGGAALPEVAAQEDSFDSRFEQKVGEKVRIAKAVVATLKPSETLFMDSSSTAYYVLREILDARIAATVLTNSLPAMAAVGSFDMPAVELVALGGSFRKLTRSFVGAETVREIQSFYADRLVFSVKGIEAQGFLTDPDPLEAEVKLAMISRARMVTLVATAEKFDERGLSVITAADRIHAAYLADPPPEGVKTLELAGVEINQA